MVGQWEEGVGIARGWELETISDFFPCTKRDLRLQTVLYHDQSEDERTSLRLELSPFELLLLAGVIVFCLQYSYSYSRSE